jgi:hypothetical protein
MSLAILTFAKAANVRGGNLLYQGLWQNVPVNTIDSQYDSLGLSASFCTIPFVGIEQINLASGRYRIEGWVSVTTEVQTLQWQARFRDNYSTPDRIVALANGGTHSLGSPGATHSGRAFIAGEFTSIGGRFVLQVRCTSPTTSSGVDDRGLGVPQNNAGVKECYALLQIHKVY